MGKITSLFAWKVANATDARVDRAGLLRGLGIDPTAPIDRGVMLEDNAYYQFLGEAARLDPDGATLPLRTGASMRLDEYGAWGLAWKSAQSLRESMQRPERYARMLTNVTTYELEETPGDAFFYLHRAGKRSLGLRLSNEASIASAFSLGLQVSTRPFQPRAVFFKHHGPGSAESHEKHFGCPVHFGADKDALLLPVDALDRPNKLGDPDMAKFFDRLLDVELAKLDDGEAWDKRVQAEVAQSLSGGIPLISDIAAKLGMSARTLQRRLGDQGVSFQDLVDESQRRLSERLLRQTTYSMLDIAFMTGFSEQSAFTRAFKRWAGQTPRSYRLQVTD
jgi:AraC-like DNA-binding protein